MRERTLIVVKRIQADAKAICANGTPQISFATPRAWINPPKVERAASRRLDRWDPEGIVELVAVGGRMQNEATREKPNFTQ